MTDTGKGPLAGLRIVEMVGIGPAPLAAMMLSDLGAEVIRIDRPSSSGLGIEHPQQFNLPARGRRSVAIDLKQPDGIACALDLISQADALIEGFRPGVMERLGLGPDSCLGRNRKLVYGRLTGWGQDGPMAKAAGHDLNYIALTGILSVIGREGEEPTPPLNFLGDYAGGSMLLAFGLVCALLHAQQTGVGQVVDAAMIDGVSLLTTALTGLRAAQIHDGPRGTNLLDGGAPHYHVYACADGTYVTVAALEPKFLQILLQRIGFDPAAFPDIVDPTNWPQAHTLLAGRFAERTRADWCAILEGTDACFAPVLSLGEAPHHPHNVARASHAEIEGVRQPASAPRFSVTVAALPGPPEAPGASTTEVLRAWGIDVGRIETLAREGILGRRLAP